MAALTFEGNLKEDGGTLSGVNRFYGREVGDESDYRAAYLGVELQDGRRSEWNSAWKLIAKERR